MKSAWRMQDGFGILGVLLIAGVIAGLSLAGWGVYQHQSQAHRVTKQLQNSKDPLMIVKYRGGLCAAADNAVQNCNAEHKLYADGTFEGHTTVTPAEIEKLRSLIAETNFLQYKVKAYPYCESYVDGTDEILVFPQKYQSKVFVLCELDVPSKDPTIQYINDLIAAHQKQ